MHNKLITIVLDRSSLSAFSWVSAGCLAVGAVFLATFEPSNVWNSFLWATLSAAAFALVHWMVIVYSSPRPRTAFAYFVAIVLLFLLILYSMSGALEQRGVQSNAIMTARTSIARSLLTEFVQDSLVRVVQYNFAVPRGRLGTISESFLHFYPLASVGSELFRRSSFMDPGRTAWGGEVFITAELTDTSVVLVGCDANAHGLDPGFSSAIDIPGIVQMRIYLTQRGIDYAFEN